MGYALTIDQEPAYKSRSITAPFDQGEGNKGIRLVFGPNFRRRVAVSAAMALSTATICSDVGETLAYVTPYASETDMPQTRASLAVSPHLVETYKEMLSYGNLPNGWDGIGSVQPEEETIESALKFLLSLPTSLSLPEPGVTADGYAEWYWENDKGVATVSFKRDRMAYYARAADRQVNRSAVFDGKSIPSELIETLEMI